MKNFSKVSYFFYGVILISLTSCEYNSTKNAPAVESSQKVISEAQVDFLSVQKLIFENRCQRCHDNIGLSLSTYEDVIKSVVAGDAESSDLYQRVKSGNMPPGPNKLSSAEVEFIRRWINDGALFKAENPEPLVVESVVEPVAEPVTVPVVEPQPTPEPPIVQNPTPVEPTPPVLVSEFLPLYSNINEKIYVTKCMSCHNGENSSSGINLNGYDNFSIYIRPNNPDRSRLLRSVESGYMPLGGEMLSQPEIAAIRQWITEGALNN